MRHVMSNAGLLLATGLLLVGGCGGDPLERKVLGFAVPTGALSSENAELVRRVRSIEQAGGLASQLDAPPGNTGDNAAVAIFEAYSDPLHLRLVPIVEELLAEDASPEERATFLETHKQLINKTAAAADLPRVRFDVGHRYGFFARMSYLNDASLAARMLLLRARHAGSDSSQSGFADLLRALRLGHELGKVQRVEARVLAERLRDESLSVAAEYFGAGRLGRFEAEQLYGRLRDQLADWPADRRALVGERATVIHAYEAIRGGMIERLLTIDERKRLKADGQLARVRAAAPADIDADEARYLNAIGKLLAVAKEPYHERLPAIQEAFEAVAVAPGLFAGPLFLQDLPQAIRAAAMDRARVEAWTLTLAAVAELKPPPFRTSPLTGHPYEAERDTDEVAVTFGDGPYQAIVLPMLPL